MYTPFSIEQLVNDAKVRQGLWQHDKEMLLQRRENAERSSAWHRFIARAAGRRIPTGSAGAPAQATS
jgi:hypothetical protein